MNWSAVGNSLELVMTTVTATATAVTALIMWRQSKGEIVVEHEDDYDWKDQRIDRIRVRIEVRNRRGSSLQIARVRAVGLPVVSVFAEERDEKHESWPANESPTYVRNIEPGTSKAFSVRVTPDWSAWSRSRPKALALRSKLFAPWSIIIEYAAKDSPNRTRRHTVKIKTHTNAIAQAASAIAASSTISS